MNIINVNKYNIDKEHICCSISDKKGDTCVESKKEWMKAQFENGLKFKKLDARGKVFIEYLPAEAAWCPIDAPGYIFVNCFWVSGQYKGKGYSNKLLEEVISEAGNEGKKGLVILSSDKKMPFLSDPGYLKYKGFKKCDQASPYFVLYYLPFEENGTVPFFKACCKDGTIPEKGMVIYYSEQCPFTSKYVGLVKEIAISRGFQLKAVRYKDHKEAQKAPSPFTTYSFFHNGLFVTNEIFSESKFIKYLDEKAKKSV